MGIAAKFARENGYRTFWEVLNECDHTSWWKGTWAEYIDVYNATAKGIREGDPDAEVGGMSISRITNFADGQGKMQMFLDSVRMNNTPVDFVSYHDYFDSYIKDTEVLSKALDEYDYFNYTQMHLNEFNVMWRNDYQQPVKYDSDMESAKMIPLMFDALDKLSNMPALTMVNWATFCDNGYEDRFGLINPDGIPLASYYVMKIFQNLPYTRVYSRSSNDNVKVIASGEDSRSCAIIYNTSSSEQDITVNLKNTITKGANINVYRLDANHGSYFDNPETKDFVSLIRYENVEKDEFNFSGKLPVNGAIYIEVDDGSNTTELELYTQKQTGTLIRKDFFYEDRQKDVFFEFDELSQTQLMGMGDNDFGFACNSISVKNPNDVININVKSQGRFKLLSGATCGIRVDYLNNNGDYSKSVYYELDDYAGSIFEKYPFGSKQAPTLTKTIKLGDNELTIKADAPQDWNGRVVIGFVMKNTGKDSQLRIRF